jgi:hypothetical protein
MADPPRVIAAVADYSSFLRAIRARVDELGITHETVDAVSGLQSGYTSKLLCDPPIRRAGPMVLFVLIQALGMQLILAEDLVGMASLRHRLTPRKATKRFNQRGGSITFTPDFYSRIGRMGAAARRAKADEVGGAGVAATPE